MVAHSELLRRHGLAQVVGMLADGFGLREGVSVEHATDVLLTLSSSRPYLDLQSYGWSEEMYVEWLTDTLATQLLARPGRARKGN